MQESFLDRYNFTVTGRRKLLLVSQLDKIYLSEIINTIAENNVANRNDLKLVAH